MDEPTWIQLRGNPRIIGCRAGQALGAQTQPSHTQQDDGLAIPSEAGTPTHEHGTERDKLASGKPWKLSVSSLNLLTYHYMRNFFINSSTRLGCYGVPHRYWRENMKFFSTSDSLITPI